MVFKIFTLLVTTKMALCMPDPNVNVNVDLKVNEGCDEDMCMLQMDPGYGDQDLTKYYYDSSNSHCTAFNYFGMGGNANRFSTFEECEKRCPRIPDKTFVETSVNGSNTLDFDPKKCNDGYLTGVWVRQPAPSTFTAADQACRQQNSMQFACPLNDATFLDWLQKQKLPGYAWFNGQQGTPGGTHFNYINWQSGKEISRYIKSSNGGTNMWNPTYPTYGENDALCVKGQELLSTESCSTPLLFYCSP